jgi:hypothetical protein
MSVFDIGPNLFRDSLVRKHVMFLVLTAGFAAVAAPCVLAQKPSLSASPSDAKEALSEPAALVDISASASAGETKTEIRALGFEKLLPFLPEAPSGWNAEAPQGNTSDAEEINLSTVQRIYEKGAEDDSPVASVTIIDPGNNQEFVKATTEVWKVASETEDGYDRPVNLDGKPGFEHYSKLAKTSSLSVFVGNRYFVQIDLTNVDPKELKTWFALIDANKLAALK